MRIATYKLQLLSTICIPSNKLITNWGLQLANINSQLETHKLQLANSNPMLNNCKSQIFICNRLQKDTCKVLISAYRFQLVKYSFQLLKCNLQNTTPKLQLKKCSLQNAACKFQILFSKNYFYCYIAQGLALGLMCSVLLPEIPAWHRYSRLSIIETPSGNRL